MWLMVCVHRWAYEVFGNDRTISFVAMATPEDLKANAEYIHMADEFVTVPGNILFQVMHYCGLVLYAACVPVTTASLARSLHLCCKSKLSGGTNNNNYANVMLIAEVAERTGANAVWAGWGHASEYPKLPETLAKVPIPAHVT